MKLGRQKCFQILFRKKILSAPPKIAVLYVPKADNYLSTSMKKSSKIMNKTPQ